MMFCAASWCVVVHCFVSEVGNGPNPNKTFVSRNRPEREPIEFGERSSGQKPMGTDELVEKESSQWQTQRRWIWSTRAIFSCQGDVPLHKLLPRVEESVWRPGGCLFVPTIPLPLSHHSNHRSIVKCERFVAVEGNICLGPRRTDTCARGESAQTRKSVRLMCCLLACLSAAEEIIRELLTIQWLQ